ncbi:MAG: cupin domain-containing protein, partial [Acidobacteria bacterium]|nr:cupin domain-containing protein [Acidobacteriota bacterium]
GGVRVWIPGAGQARTEGTRTYRQLVCREHGSKGLSQTVSEYAPGRSMVRVNPVSEEVLYVVSGHGTCRVSAFDYPLETGAGVFVPPDAEYSFDNPGPDKLVIVAVTCPEDDLAHVVQQPIQRPDSKRKPPRRLVREQERKIATFGDRQFRVLVGEDLGCKNMTQFAGYIPPSKDPLHAHTYEEAVYVLQGSGIVHTDTESCQFTPGSTIYLPAGVNHCVENPLTTAVRVLGVFQPAGSPAARYHKR